MDRVTMFSEGFYRIERGYRKKRGKNEKKGER